MGEFSQLNHSAAAGGCFLLEECVTIYKKETQGKAGKL
jgi:hypothetical protein